MTNPLKLDINFDDTVHADEEKVRARIRGLIEKMDLPQLEVMCAIALSSASEKDREILKMLNPTKRKKRSRGKR